MSLPRDPRYRVDSRGEVIAWDTVSPRKLSPRKLKLARFLGHAIFVFCIGSFFLFVAGALWLLGWLILSVVA